LQNPIPRLLVPSLVVGFVGAVAGVLLGHTAVTPHYMSSVTVKVSSTASSTTSQHMELLRGQQVVEQAAGDELWLAAGHVASPESTQWFREHLSVTNPDDGDLIVVSFTEASPPAAEAGVNAFVSAYKRHQSRATDQYRADRLADLHDLESEKVKALESMEQQRRATATAGDASDLRNAREIHEQHLVHLASLRDVAQRA